MPRHPATAPRGRLTLRQVAAQSGLSYERVCELVRKGEVPSTRIGDVYTVSAKDAARVQRRPRSNDPRKPYMVRVKLDRAAAWERAAKATDPTQPVSTWLGELADAASGWRR